MPLPRHTAVRQHRRHQIRGLPPLEPQTPREIVPVPTLKILAGSAGSD
jgi:hypothetical protein